MGEKAGDTSEYYEGGNCVRDGNLHFINLMLTKMISSDASYMLSPFTKALDILSLPRHHDLACSGNEADP